MKQRAAPVNRFGGTGWWCWSPQTRRSWQARSAQNTRLHFGTSTRSRSDIDGPDYEAHPLAHAQQAEPAARGTRLKADPGIPDRQLDGLTRAADVDTGRTCPAVFHDVGQALF